MKTKKNASTLPAPPVDDDDLSIPGYAHPWDGEPAIGTRELRVIRTRNGEVVYTVNISLYGEREIERIRNDLLAHGCRIEDSKDDL
jgi:hypothetical protein